MMNRNQQMLANLFTAASRAGHGWTMHPAAKALVDGFAERWDCYCCGDTAWLAFADAADALEDARAREKYVLYKGYTPKDYEYSSIYDHNEHGGVHWTSRHGRLAVYVTADGIRVVVRRPGGCAFEVRNIGDAVTVEYSGIAVHYGVLLGLEQVVFIATGREIKVAGRIPGLDWGDDGEDFSEGVIVEADWASIKALVEEGAQ